MPACCCISETKAYVRLYGPHVAYVFSHILWKLTFGDKIRSSTMSKRCLQSTHLFWCSYTIPNKRMLMVKNKTRYSMIHEPHTAIDLKPARQRPVIRKRRVMIHTPCIQSVQVIQTEVKLQKLNITCTLCFLVITARRCSWHGSPQTA
jgi:hypothetical protein